MPEPTNEIVKEALQEVTKPADFPGTFTLGDGTVVKAANWEEAFNKVAEMKSNTAAALRDREEQIRQLNERAPAETRTLPPTTTGFDQKKYWELMNTDPVAGNRYALAHDLGMGDTPELLPQLFQEMRNVSVFSADNFEIQSFMSRNPDFPGTDDAADRIMQRLEAENRPLTAENLEYTYLRAVRDGEIEPLGTEATPNYVPPTLRGGSTREDQNLLEQVKNVPDDKLDEFYRKIGMLK